MSARLIVTGTRIALATLLAVGVPAIATAASGTANLRGPLTLAAKGCGSHHGKATATVTLAANGTWSVQVDFGTLTGTYVALDTAGRKLDLDFDPASLVALQGIVAGDVTEACRRPAQLTGATKKKFRLTLNRKLTKATLTIRYLFTGAPGTKPATASEAIVLHGRWIAS